MPRMLRRDRLVLALTMLAASGCGAVKDAANSVEKALDKDEPYDAVPGEAADKHLESATFTPSTDPNALLGALKLAEADTAKEGAQLLGLVEDAEGSVNEADDATVDYLKGGQAAKQDIKTDAFKLPDPATLGNVPKEKAGAGLHLNLLDEPKVVADPATFVAASDAVAATSAAWGGKSEIMVSTSAGVAVRDQAARGTCAAHAGVGELEHWILKKYPSLKGVDLSEQRFYFMSKKDNWQDGGVTDQDGGSYWGSGYLLSSGQDGELAPSDNNPSFNIPLEADCPYNPAGGSNELQVPQSSACLRGAVKVTKTTETYWQTKGGGPKTWYSNAVMTAEQILTYLREKDLPVPIASTLDDAWRNNEGMITLAKSKELTTVTQDGHTGGHAYLVVGARKLDEAKFPGEGGMCFVIKNSWGLGWGANGFSCMTLAWFNAHRRSESYDVAVDVVVDEAYLGSKFAGGVPADLPAPEKKPPDVPPAPTPEPAPAVVAAPPAAGPTPAPAPAPAPATPATPAAPVATKTADGYTVAKLVTGSSGAVQALTKTEGSTLKLRGIHKGQTGQTQDLSLTTSGDKILHTQKKGDKEITAQVGTVSGDRIELCGGKFVEACNLNFLEASNELKLGLSEAEFRNEEADPDAKFESLVSFQGYGIEYFHDGKSTKVDLRLKIKGEVTNPIRLKVKIVDGDILYKGKTIGNYQKGALCSGAFKDVCRIVVSATQKKINIFFKAKKN